MKNIYLLATLILGISNVAFSQITTDYNAPNNDPIHLIDNILLGGGVVASNHSYQGDTMQIGFFNGINSNIDRNLFFLNLWFQNWFFLWINRNFL